MTSDVWVHDLDLDQPRSVSDPLIAALPPAEQHGTAAHRLTRAVARDVLGGHLGRDPATIEFSRHCTRCGDTRHGKPAVVGDRQCAFSVTHSGSRALIAVGPDGAQLGVDLECVQPRRDLPRLAARVLAPDELAAWRARPAAGQLVAFLRCWTAKEAVLKARGLGIATALAAVCAEPPGWSSRELDVPGYVAWLAVDRPEVTVHRVTWWPATANGGTGG